MDRHGSMLKGTMLELIKDIISGPKDQASAKEALAYIGRVRRFYAFAWRYMSRKGQGEAEKLVDGMERDMDKANELVQLILRDPGIAAEIDGG